MLHGCNRIYKLFDKFAFMKTTLAERLNEAMKESGVTPGDLASACGIRVQAVYQWQSGKTKKLEGDNLLIASKRLHVRPEWLSNGTGHKHPSGDQTVAIPAGASIGVHDSPADLDKEAYVWIDRYDLRLSAGNGNADWIINEKDPISFRRSWFSQRRLSPDMCKALYVRGRSMEPKLDDWDTVLINTADTHDLVDGEIYAVAYNGALYIKTLERTGNGIRLKSENPAFDSIEIQGDDMKKLTILGRKVWRAG